MIKIKTMDNHGRTQTTLLATILLIVIIGGGLYLFTGREGGSPHKRIVKRVKIEPYKPPIEEGRSSTLSRYAEKRQEPVKTPTIEKKDVAEAKPVVKEDKSAARTGSKGLEKTITKKPVKTATTKKVAKAEGKTAAKTTVKKYRWAINLSSTSSIQDALNLAKRLEEKGYNAYITDYKSKKGNIWHRVRVGFYPSKDEAERVASKLSKEFFLFDYWIVRPSSKEVIKHSKR